MNLQQLRFLCTVADSGFNITTAAKALHATQSGVSKQLSALERELGVDILVHRGNRIAGFTAPGLAILAVARRMLNDMRTVNRIGEDFLAQNIGQLVIATAYTHARYILPDVVESFTKRYPKVKLVMRQAYPPHVPEQVAKGEADIGISGETDSTLSNLAMLPCYRLRRILLAPARHPVLRTPSITLSTIARYPILAMDTSFISVKLMAQTFCCAGEKPAIAMSATDAEIIKWYVAKGMGIAILPSIAFDAERDRELRARDVGHLFSPVTTSLILRRDAYLQRYMLDLIQMLAPQWTANAVMRGLEDGNNPVADDAELPVFNADQTGQEVTRVRHSGEP
jgi:LysR family cys regulon transcriptional activator